MTEYMRYPLSEVIDRISILKLRFERSERDAELMREINKLWSAAFRYEMPITKLDYWITQLLRVNGLIWDLEADIRAGKEGELGLEEIGRRALAIRELNKERIARKNEIARAMHEFEEVKVDHASA